MTKMANMVIKARIKIDTPITMKVISNLRLLASEICEAARHIKQEKPTNCGTEAAVVLANFLTAGTL